MLKKTAFLMTATSAKVYNLNLNKIATESICLENLRIGDVINIRASENPSTGYEWIMTPTSNSDLYQVTQDKHYNEYYDNFSKNPDSSNEPMMMGVPGEREIQL